MGKTLSQGWFIDYVEYAHARTHAGGGGVLRTCASKMLIHRNTRCDCSVTRTWHTWQLHTFNPAGFNLTQMWPWYIKYLDNNAPSAQIIFHRDIDKYEPVCKYQKDINSAVILLRFRGGQKQGKWREGDSKSILEASDLVPGRGGGFGALGCDFDPVNTHASVTGVHGRKRRAAVTTHAAPCAPANWPQRTSVACTGAGDEKSNQCSSPPSLLFRSSNGADAAAGSALFRPQPTTTESDAKRRKRAAAFSVFLRSESRPERF